MPTIKNTVSQRCPTFAAFVRTMSMKILKLRKHCVDFCFYVCKSSSIKHNKQRERGNEKTKKNFSFGPRQKIPDNIDDLLQISQFKIEFLRLLMNEYKNLAY